MRVLNLVNLEQSDGYNPFRYLRDEKDVLKLVNNLIQSTLSLIHISKVMNSALEVLTLIKSSPCRKASTLKQAPAQTRLCMSA